MSFFVNAVACALNVSLYAGVTHNWLNLGAGVLCGLVAVHEALDVV